MNSNPNTPPPTQNCIDFRDRNAVERFLETKKFRRCTNLQCESVSPDNMQTLYMPACLEGRFAREGFAQHIEMPLRSRHLGPITYTTIPQWAPLISCPPDCKGYRNRTVAKLRTLFKKQPHVVDSHKSTPKWEWWIAGILIPVAGIIIALFQPEVRVWLGLEKPKPAIHSSNQSPQPQTTLASPSAPEAKAKTETKTRHAKSKAVGGESASASRAAGSGNQADTGTQINAPQGIAIGGNATVDNPTVNNFGPPQRTISQTDRPALISALSQHRGKVTFGVLGMDPASESFKFAQELYGIFDASGWTMNNRMGTRIMPMASSTPWSGIEVNFEGNPKDFTAADWNRVPPDSLFAARALLSAHVKRVQVGPQPGVGKEFILIIVGPNPEN